MVPTLIRICRIQWWRSLFLFLMGNTFLSKFGPKNQNFQFKLQFGSKGNFNMKNSMVVFNFSLLNQKYSFRENLVPKIKIVSSGWNLVPTIMFITFWDFLKVEQIFLLPQVKRSIIISNKHGIYKLPHELPNDFRLRI